MFNNRNHSSVVTFSSHRRNKLDLAGLAPLHRLAWITQHAVLNLAYVHQPLDTLAVRQGWKPPNLHEATVVHHLAHAGVVDPVQLRLSVSLLLVLNGSIIRAAAPPATTTIHVSPTRRPPPAPPFSTASFSSSSTIIPNPACRPPIPIPTTTAIPAAISTMVVPIIPVPTTIPARRSFYTTVPRTVPRTVSISSPAVTIVLAVDISPLRRTPAGTPVPAAAAAPVFFVIFFVVFVFQLRIYDKQNKKKTRKNKM